MKINAEAANIFVREHSVVGATVMVDSQTVEEFCRACIVADPYEVFDPWILEMAGIEEEDKE